MNCRVHGTKLVYVDCDACRGEGEREGPTDYTDEPLMAKCLKCGGSGTVLDCEECIHEDEWKDEWR